MINIAICDDMPIFNEFIEQFIKEYEKEKNDCFLISKFLSGEDFIMKFDKDQVFFDLIFLDYYMEKITGIETALYIRQFNIDCHIVFVSSAIEFYKEFLKVNPLGILSKPVSKKQIFSILDKLYE